MSLAHFSNFDISCCVPVQPLAPVSFRPIAVRTCRKVPPKAYCPAWGLDVINVQYCTYLAARVSIAIFPPTRCADPPRLLAIAHLSMPCRTAHVRRALHATSSAPQCLWITDAVLAEAFNRFACLSLAARHHSRHGSNVPGPLEARKRLARRRMGMTTTGAASASCQGSFAALPPGGGFWGLEGIPQYTEVNFQFKWQPPSLGVERRGQPELQEKDDQAWLRHLGVPAEEPDGPDVSTITASQENEHCEPQETAAVEKDEFTPLLEELHRLRPSKVTTAEGKIRLTVVVNKHHLGPLLALLDKTTGPELTKNVTRLTSFLSRRALTENAVKALLAVVSKKRQSRDLSLVSLSQILADMVSNKHQDVIMPQITSFLAQSLQTDIFPRLCLLITQEVLNRLSKSRDRKLLPPSLDAWLNSLVSLQTREKQYKWMWTRIWAAIAKECPYPGAFAKYLCHYRDSELAWMLLRNWIPQLTRSSRRYNSKPPKQLGTVTYLDGEKLFKFPASFQHAVLPVEMLIDDFASNNGITYGPRSLVDPLVDLLALLARHRIPHTRIADQMLEILAHRGSTARLSRFVDCQFHCPTLGVSVDMGTNSIRHFMEAGDLQQAYHVFRNIPGIPFSTCFSLPWRMLAESPSKSDGPNLAVHLAKDNAVPASWIMQMLFRQTPGDQRPIPRDTPLPHLTLWPQHIDTVQLVAHKFAESEALPTRVAYRRVWECYRFLKDRGAPMGPLMSRALVMAGIIRPLKEGKGGSQVKIDFILPIVASIEGRDEAIKLDQILRALWARNALPRAVLEEKRQQASRAEDSSDSATSMVDRKQAPMWRKHLWAKPKVNEPDKWYSMPPPEVKAERDAAKLARKEQEERERMAAQAAMLDRVSKERNPFLRDPFADTILKSHFAELDPSLKIALAERFKNVLQTDSWQADKAVVAKG